jgi:transcriptional regulator with XRE-family HTH domain
MVAMVDAQAGLSRLLGDELRRERKRRGWTRKDLHARLGWNLAVQTLATYELGTRTLSVEHLVELTDALGVSVPDVLARALARVGNVGQTNRLEIDLHKITSDRSAESAPLRGWAQTRLRQIAKGQPTSARLDHPAIMCLAQVCGLDAEELTARLCDYTA